MRTMVELEHANADEQRCSSAYSAARNAEYKLYGDPLFGGQRVRSGSIKWPHSGFLPSRLSRLERERSAGLQDGLTRWREADEKVRKEALVSPFLPMEEMFVVRAICESCSECIELEELRLVLDPERIQPLTAEQMSDRDCLWNYRPDDHAFSCSHRGRDVRMLKFGDDSDSDEVYDSDVQ